MEKKTAEKKANQYVVEVFATHIDYLKKNQSQYTADNYQNVLRSVSGFMGSRMKKFRIEDITEMWLNTYLQHLKEDSNLAPGSVDSYLRILSSVYNKALKAGPLPPDFCNPFIDIHITVPPTLKRTLSKEDIVRVIEIDLSNREDLCKARDVFMFLFYARGMCFIDVFNMAYDSVTGGYISYRRSKTAAPLQVKIEPEMKEIMERYREENDPCLFPFLHKNCYNKEKKIHKKSSLKRINRQLGVLGKMLGLVLTTYVARHSWASLLEECGTSISIISQGMGHASERVTKIYLKGIPSQMIDKANEDMLNKLIRRKSIRDKKKCPLLCENETSQIAPSTKRC